MIFPLPSVFHTPAQCTATQGEWREQVGGRGGTSTQGDVAEGPTNNLMELITQDNMSNQGPRLLKAPVSS